YGLSAVTHLSQAVTAWRELGDARNEADTRRLLGDALRNAGRHAEAVAELQHALALYQTQGHHDQTRRPNRHRRNGSRSGAEVQAMSSRVRRKRLRPFARSGGAGRSTQPCARPSGPHVPAAQPGMYFFGVGVTLILSRSRA